MKKGLQCLYMGPSPAEASRPVDEREESAHFEDDGVENLNSETQDHNVHGSSNFGLESSPIRSGSGWTHLQLSKQTEDGSPYMMPTPESYHVNAPTPTATEERVGSSSNPRFANVHLVPGSENSGIGERWLAGVLPSTSPKLVKSLLPATVRYSYRVLKTYPMMMLQPGGLPPIIHPLQISGQETPAPLANCLSLVRLWEGHVEGSESIVTTTVKNEIDKLYEEVRSK